MVDAVVPSLAGLLFITIVALEETNRLLVAHTYHDFALFTDYKYVQGDWENTLEFSINRYLSTRLFAHLRYDTSVPPLEGSKWKRWQFKEILSFGLSYKFSTKPKK